MRKTKISTIIDSELDVLKQSSHYYQSLEQQSIKIDTEQTIEPIEQATTNEQYVNSMPSMMLLEGGTSEDAQETVEEPKKEPISERIVREIAREVARQQITKYRSEVDDQFKEQQVVIDQSEKVVKEVNMITMASGDKLLDAITKHVTQEVLNKKLREFRNEMFSKSEFQNQITKYVSSYDLEKVKKEINQNIQLTKSKLTDIQGSERDVANNIQGLRILIDDCAKLEQTEYITERLHDKVEVKDFSTFKDYVELDFNRVKDANEFKDDVDIQFEEVKEVQKILASKAEVIKVQSELKNKIDKNFEKTSLAKQCEKDRTTLQKLLDKQQVQIDKMQKQIKKLEKKQEEHSANFEVKVDIEELEEIKDLILQLPKVEDVNSLKKYVTENIEKFGVDNKAFHKDFYTQNEIIRRYDEVLSQKESKIRVEDIINKTSESLNSKISSISHTLGTLEQVCSQYDDRFDQMREAIFEEIEQKISQKLKKERQKTTQQQANPTDVLAGEGAANLKKIIGMKADKTDLEKLFEIKSNKIDIENVLDIQTIIGKQFKHILVLFMEITNCQTIKANETKQGLEKRVQNLIKQIQVLSNWVMNFDPIDYMNSADANNVQLMNSVDEAQFKNFTDMVLQDIKMGPRHQNISKNSIMQSFRATKFLHNENSMEKISPRSIKPLMTASLNKRNKNLGVITNRTNFGVKYFEKALSPSNKINFRESMNQSEEPGHRLSATTTGGFRNLLGQNFVEQTMASRDFSQTNSIEEGLDVNLEKSNIYIQGGHQSVLNQSDDEKYNSTISTKMGAKGSQFRKSVNDGLPKI